MSEASRLINATLNNDPAAASQLLPLVYDELRRLAGVKMAAEQRGGSLQATALVHEAYLRLIEGEPDREWEGRGHFFSAAAEAMRRILVDRARRKQRVKHGGDRARHRLAEDAIEAPHVEDLKSELLELDSALDALQKEKPRMAELVKLRYFVGLTLDESAELLKVSPATADRDWAFARAWLYRQINGSSSHQT